MNLRLPTLLFAAALCGAPLVMAQAQPQGGEGGESAESGREGLQAKTDAELEAEFGRLAREISKGMGKLESDIAKVSLPPRRAEELKSELDALLKLASEGTGKTVHEGLRSWFEANPARAAEVLGATEAEIAELLKNDADFIRRLGERSTEVAKALEDSTTLQNVLQRQAEIELRVAELIEKQQKQSADLAKTMEQILDVAYEIRDRKPP